MAALYLPPWRIDVERRPGTPKVLPLAELARVAARALTAADAPAPASLAVILSDDSELAELNATHMDRHGATDVLSFPMLPPSAFPAHAGQDPALRRTPVMPFARPPRQRLHLGDVVISVERAIDQAAHGRGGQTSDVTWSARDELRLLVVHGVLHLCGWDHAARDEDLAMRARERELLGQME